MKRALRRLSRCSALAAVLAACTAAGSDMQLPDPVADVPRAASAGESTAVLAGGCFWGVEGVFRHVRGVKQAVSGYAGGEAKNAHYDLVSRGGTGHAEAVKIVFDPAQISYGQLLKIFFSVAHDPTQLNRQGPDVGDQYRSAIFYADSEQRRIAASYVAQLGKSKLFDKPIVTRIAPLTAFYQAEAYHQNYMGLHPHSAYIVVNDRPKLQALKKNFAASYRADGGD